MGQDVSPFFKTAHGALSPVNLHKLTSQTDDHAMNAISKTAIGFVIGLGLGVTFGVTIDNVALGITIGANLGIFLGVAFGKSTRNKC